MTKARPRLKPQAIAVAMDSTAYGPAVCRPSSESGIGASHVSAPVKARIAAGTPAGRSALSSSGSSGDFKAIRPEADIAQPPPLGALADVLGELLGIESLGGTVLPLHPGHGERLAVGR